MYKEIIKNYTENFWNKRQLNEAEKVFHEQAVVHTTFGKFVGPSFMKATAQTWIKAFPDLRMHVTDLIEEGNKLALIWTAQGTHKDSFRGILPTNRAVSSHGVTIFRFQDKKVIEYWIYTDIQDVLNQIT
jgi:steroid delta-isomerase-like uncharacterized protein